MNLIIIATAKVIRTFLIVETLDLLSLEPSAFCPVPSAICAFIWGFLWMTLATFLSQLPLAQALLWVVGTPFGRTLLPCDRY